MKAAKVAIGIIALAMLITALSSNASADTETISPGGSYSVHAELGENEMVSSWWWQSTGNLHFTLRDPDGTLIDESTSMADSGALTPFTAVAGQYTFTWENTGSSSVTLTYTVSWMGDIEEGFSMLAWAAIIAGVVVAVIIVLVVVLIVMSDRKKTTAAPMVGMTGPMPMGPVGPNCPRCGMPVPSEGMFCAKCGAKIR